MPLKSRDTRRNVKEWSVETGEEQFNPTPGLIWKKRSPFSPASNDMSTEVSFATDEAIIVKWQLWGDLACAPSGNHFLVWKR